MARPKGYRKPMAFDVPFGRRLRLLRAAIYGRSDRYVGGLEELARRIGVNKRSLYGWETGVTMPGEACLSLIVETGVSPSWLLTGKGSMFAAPAPVGTSVDDLDLARALINHAAASLARADRARRAGEARRGDGIERQPGQHAGAEDGVADVSAASNGRHGKQGTPV